MMAPSYSSRSDYLWIDKVSIAALNKEFPRLDPVDECEEQRLQDVVADKKERGKGAPKKVKPPCTS